MWVFAANTIETAADLPQQRADDDRRAIHLNSLPGPDRTGRCVASMSSHEMELRR